MILFSRLLVTLLKIRLKVLVTILKYAIASYYSSLTSFRHIFKKTSIYRLTNLSHFVSIRNRRGAEGAKGISLEKRIGYS